MKKNEGGSLVENFTANVVVLFNFYQFLYLTPFGLFEVDGGVFWSCGSFGFVEL